MIEPREIKKKSALKSIPGGADPENEKFEYEAEKHYILVINEWIRKKYDIRYNQMTLDVEFKLKEAETYRIFDVFAENDIWIDMALSNVKVNGKETGEKLIKKITHSSRFTDDFHPLITYLNGLKWDGKDHIKQLSNSLYLSNELDLYIDGKPQSYYFPMILKRWLLNSAAIALGREGVGNGHVMLIIEGKQQKGKTTWLNNLCPKSMEVYLYCAKLKLDDHVNTSNYMAEKWFINIDDQMQNLFAKDFNDIKSLITAVNVTNRKSYERSAKQRQRTSSFMATVNGREIFTDSENRRYVCFCIDNEKPFCYDQGELAKVNIEQVWAQTMHLLNKGEKYFYTPAEMQVINKMNLMFNQTKPEEEWLMRCFAPSDITDAEAIPLQSSEMLSVVRNISKQNLQQFWWTKALEKLHFVAERKKMKKYGDQVRSVFFVRLLYKEDMFAPNHYSFITHE
jgi:predicted P-loop ATPase